MHHFRRTFIVIDALDEHLSIDDGEHITEVTLLARLLDIQRQTARRLTMLITSRELDAIGNQLLDRTRLEIRANDDDVRAYVSSRINNNSPFAEKVRRDAEFAEAIVEGVVRKARGV